MYAEVVQTRGAAARSRAEQARDFRSTLERHQREHTRYARAMGARVAARDRTIASLGRTVRTLEHRVAEAESRVRREARRANEAQERLGALLDEVLGTAVLDLDEASLVPGSALVEAERTDVRHRSGTRGAGHAARATGARADDGSAADERAARPRPTVVELVGWEARGGTTAGARGDGGAVA
jgi:hypothetical protein